MQRIHVAPSARMSVQSSEKNQANLFEAYIAGYFESILCPVSKCKENGVSTPPAKTEGQAYDAVSAWLVPIFTPIAHFYREQLQAEQERRSQNGRDEDGDDHIDSALVTGSTARLNEFFIGRVGTGMPIYDSYQLQNSLMWKTSCTVVLRDGKTL